MAIQAVAMTVLAWYAAASFHRYTHERTLAELQRVLPVLTERYAGPLRAGMAQADLDRMVKADGERSTIRISIVGTDGTVLADSEADPRAMENHRSRPEIDAALSGTFKPDVRSSATTQEPTTYIAQTLMQDGQPLAVIRAALPLRTASSVPTHVMRAVGAATLALMALTFIIFYLISRRLSRSVWRLAESASRFAAGNLSHRIVRPTSQELAALAEALNHMAERLSEQIELLQTQRNLQQAIYQSMSNGMLALDAQQRIISINRAAERLLGISGEAARGQLLQEALREPDFHRFVAQSIASDQQASSEFQLHSAPGSRVQVVSERLRDAREQPVGLLVLITDVTQLRRLETIRSDFAANVSHELRTPITNIKGYVETMLQVGVDDQAQTQRFLEVINRNTARLASIVEDLLALARLEQPGARKALERAAIPVDRVIGSTLVQFEPDIRVKGMNTVVQASPGLQVHANEQLLEQALSNLVSNAIKYSPPNTTITITAEPMGSKSVVLAVADEGTGIPREHQERIFERFYRVDLARSREMGGTGLGLAIVKHIALVHGGAVTVESEAGRGSTFRITLPQ